MWEGNLAISCHCEERQWRSNLVRVQRLATSHTLLAMTEWNLLSLRASAKQSHGYGF